ncbi:MAG: FGGY-family carbohydrate kinase [Chloroflexia bacterium]
MPARDDDFAYISSGTWSLVGLELPAPVLTPEAMEANFTNEGGFGGTVRFLKNVMGLWLLQDAAERGRLQADRTVTTSSPPQRRFRPPLEHS